MRRIAKSIKQALRSIRDGAEFDPERTRRYPSGLVLASIILVLFLRDWHVRDRDARPISRFPKQLKSLLPGPVLPAVQT
jgi:hypothetical protein